MIPNAAGYRLMWDGVTRGYQKPAGDSVTLTADAYLAWASLAAHRGNRVFEDMGWLCYHTCLPADRHGHAPKETAPTGARRFITSPMVAATLLDRLPVYLADRIRCMREHARQYQDAQALLQAGGRQLDADGRRAVRDEATMHHDHLFDHQQRMSHLPATVVGMQELLGELADWVWGQLAPEIQQALMLLAGQYRTSGRRSDPVPLARATSPVLSLHPVLQSAYAFHTDAEGHPREVAVTVPVVECSLLGPQPPDGAIVVQVLLCPYCGESHIHRAQDVIHGPGAPRDFGHRAAHCSMPMFPKEAGYHLRWDGYTCGDQRTSERRSQLMAAMGTQWRDHHATRTARMHSMLPGLTLSLEQIVATERRREDALLREARADW